MPKRNTNIDFHKAADLGSPIKGLDHRAKSNTPQWSSPKNFRDGGRTFKTSHAKGNAERTRYLHNEPAVVVTDQSNPPGRNMLKFEQTE